MTAPRDRLRIAVQKSGRLGDPARALLASCGLVWRESPDRLFCYGESAPVDLLLVRDDDIPGLIGDGLCDLGIVGRNVLREQADDLRRQAQELRALGFGQCRLALAVPQEWNWQGPQQLAGKRIATSYPILLQQWLDEHGVQAQIVMLSGSVEIAPRLGQADAICDLVSSGATLAANQLRAVQDILASEAVLAAPATPLHPVLQPIAEMLLRRLDGVMRVRDSKLLMFQTPRSLLAGLLPLLPDAEEATVCGAVEGSDLISLQALCHGVVSWQRLEELKRAGARQLMVLPVERALA